MFSEPKVACPHGHTTCTLEEGASQGMRCHHCGATLRAIDSQWIFDSITKNPGTAVSGAGAINEEKVAELQLPAHNEVDEEAVGQFITSMPLPISLEIYGVGDRRVMLVRGTEDSLKFMAGKVQSLWPSAVLRILDQDPMQSNGGHKSISRFNFSFTLGAASYLPIRTWMSFRHGDPVHTLLATTLGLMPDEKVWLQFLIARKGKPPWLEAIQRRLKLEAQRGYTVNANGLTATTTPTFSQVPMPQSLSMAKGGVFLMVILIALVAILFAIQEKWLPFILLSLLVIAGGGILLRFVSKDDDPWHGADLSLVRQKVVHQDMFYQVAVRASVWAATLDKARALAERLDSAMAQYSLAGGNRFQIAVDPFEGIGTWPVHFIDRQEGWMWLGPDEVAGLWHPPMVNGRVSPGLVPVRGVEMRSPDPEDVKGFYQIGKYFTADGGEKPVRISSKAMQHNLFCVGKPGVGKSTLMLHLSLAGMRDEENPAVIVIDPHGDLVNQLIGAIDPEDAERVRILDVGDQEYTLTFNPLDVHRVGWGVIEVTNSVVDIGKALWSDYWGPRMQIPLKRGVQLLVAANEQRPDDDCLGLSQLSAILSAHPDVRKNFIRTELEGSQHRMKLAHYFLDDYETLSRHFREQVIQPVLSKAYRFEEDPMLALFSCPQSKLDIAEVIRERKLLVINTGMSKYGSEISDFVGSLMINVLLRELVRQGERFADSRVPVMVVIDEFQTFTGVPWAELIQQMRKYGGRMILGTQSLASLRKQDINIPEIILSGVYSLFAFNINGDDADYISRLELSRERGGPGADTLISLEPYKAYVRLEREDGRLSRPFYFESEPPPEKDEMMAERVRAMRAEYSLPHEVARQRAMEMLTYFDQYGATVLSSGVTSSGSRLSASASSSQAAGVLLGGSKERSGFEEAVGEVDLPWSVEGDARSTAPNGDAAAEASEVLMGREIKNGWEEEFLADVDYIYPDEGHQQDDE